MHLQLPPPLGYLPPSRRQTTPHVSWASQCSTPRPALGVAQLSVLLLQPGNRLEVSSFGVGEPRVALDLLPINFNHAAIGTKRHRLPHHRWPVNEESHA